MNQDIQMNEQAPPPLPVAAPPVFSYAEQEKAALQQQFAAGASWFYWIAGLSLINSTIAFAGGSWHFIFGLGVTEIVDAIVTGTNLGTAGKILAFAFAVLIAGMFALFGFLSHKKMRWPFWVGMVIYALDGVLLLLFSAWLPAAVHGYVLYRMFAAVSAVKKLGELEQ